MRKNVYRIFFRTGSINKNKEALARERDRLLNEINLAKDRYAQSVRYQEDLEKKSEAMEAKLMELTAEFEV